jgi:hypothetical protein
MEGFKYDEISCKQDNGYVAVFLEMFYTLGGNKLWHYRISEKILLIW